MKSRTLHQCSQKTQHQYQVHGEVISAEFNFTGKQAQEDQSQVQNTRTTQLAKVGTRNPNSAIEQARNRCHIWQQNKYMIKSYWTLKINLKIHGQNTTIPTLKLETNLAEFGETRRINLSGNFFFSLFIFSSFFSKTDACNISSAYTCQQSKPI